MDIRSHSEDQRLVRECLAGSEVAWNVLYTRFIGLMRAVVRRRHSSLSCEDIEDITQSAFLSLTTALNTYDSEQSLPRFISLITERIVIDEYRKGRATKRAAETNLPDGSSYLEETASANQDDQELQDEQLAKAELASALRASLRSLDERCRQLITLRYLNELPFKEIADAMKATENTVTVQTRRCLEALRAKMKSSVGRGPRS